MTPNILVVEDEAKMRDILKTLFDRMGYTTVCARDKDEALRLWQEQRFHLVISDVRLRQGREDGIDLLGEIKKRAPHVPIILITAMGSVSSAVAAMRKGAYDYIEKPVDLDELKLITARALEQVRLQLEVEKLREELRGRRRGALIGKSEAMLRLQEIIAQVGPTNVSVLITGESGTGKELAARAIHEAGGASLPFVAVNCAALPASLLESEIFGYVRGAFTDATKDKEGLLAAAGEGTLFLDEIAEMHPSLQAKLLRAIETREMIPLGATKPSPVKARIIAATNQNVEEAVRRGDLRQDLYFRLKVIQIHIPPLRQRREDIPLLVHHFITRFADKYDKRVTLSKGLLDRLVRYDWPGNVRELENMVERWVVLARDGEELTPEHLEDAPPVCVQRTGRTAEKGAMDFQALLDRPYAKAREEVMSSFHRQYFTRLLEKTEGNISKAAQSAGIHRRQVQRYIERYLSDLKRQA